MEMNSDIREYSAEIRRFRPEGSSNNGLIFLKADPLTKGHHNLMLRASKASDTLFVLPVDPEETMFPLEARLEMIRGAAREFPNTVILPPLENVTPDLLARHIAPHLGIRTLFTGTGPSDPEAKTFHEEVTKALGDAGVSVKAIKRLSLNTVPISSRRARDMRAYGLTPMLRFLMPSSIPVILAHYACSALHTVIDLTPKPGLVDAIDCGAQPHLDLDTLHATVESLRSHFAHFASIAASRRCSTDDIRRAGIDAEAAALECSNGAISFRGVIFSLGLVVMAAAKVIAGKCKPCPDSLREKIQDLAADFHTAPGSTGELMGFRYGLKGLADYARDGFSSLFFDWLKFYRNVRNRRNALNLLFLRIMITLADTSLLAAAGPRGAEFVHQTANRIIVDYSDRRMADANTEFAKRNLAPTAAAEMLALTLLTDSILNYSNRR